VSGTLARLKRRADFLSVAAARRKWVAPGVIVQARRRAGESPRASKDAPLPGRAVPPTGGQMEELPRHRRPMQTDPSRARVGFTVSRKVGSAVARNRVRRRLKAAVASLEPGCVDGGMDVVVIGRTETLKRSFPDLIGDLTQAFKRLGVWKENE
jgi:ribonuclease P protein component